MNQTPLMQWLANRRKKNNLIENKKKLKKSHSPEARKKRGESRKGRKLSFDNNPNTEIKMILKWFVFFDIVAHSRKTAQKLERHWLNVSIWNADDAITGERTKKLTNKKLSFLSKSE